MRKGRGQEERERGSVMIMAAAFTVVMVLMAALAIDIGRQALDKRSDHKVADLAALDGTRALGDVSPCVAATLVAHVQDVVRNSAGRNGYDYTASGNNLQSEIGTDDPVTKVFTPVAPAAACTGNAVRATVGSVTKYQFQPGSNRVGAQAVAMQVPWGRFWMGSFLGTLSSDDSTLLNKLIGHMISGTDLNLSLVSWQGLASSAITLDALQKKLVDQGLDVGTPDKLMNTQITLYKLGTAAAQAFSDQGMIAQANAMNAIAASASGSAKVTLGKMMTLSQGNGSSAADLTAVIIPGLVLVTGAAEVANGNNFVSIPNVSVNVPGVASTSLSLQAVQQGIYVEGPVPTSRQTNQVNMTVTPTLNDPISLPPLVGATVTGNLPITVTAGGAVGTLEAARCKTWSNPGMTVGVDPKAFSVNSTGTLSLNANVLGVATTIANVGVTGSQTTTGTHADLSFSYPSEFMPPAGTKRGGSTTLGLTGGMYSTTTVQMFSGLISSSAAANGVLGSLNPVVTAVDNLIISRVARLLGLNVGGADVAAVNVTCSGVGLVS